VYRDYLERGEADYDELDALLSDLETDAWQIVERIAKQSYRNGISRGRTQRPTR
jgi:hypothetical protein